MKLVSLFVIIIGAATLLIGLVIATKHFKPLQFNLIVGIIITVFTLLGIFGKYLQEIVSSEKTSKILGKQEQTDSKVEELKKNVTGGDSYCIFEVNNIGQGRVPSFYILHHGNEPLRDIIVNIDDYTRRQKLMDEYKKANKPIDHDLINQTTYRFYYPILSPQTGIFNIDIPLDHDQKDINLSLEILLPSGRLFETVKVSDFRTNNRKLKIELYRGDVLIDKREI